MRCHKHKLGAEGERKHGGLMSEDEQGVGSSENKRLRRFSYQCCVFARLLQVGNRSHIRGQFYAREVLDVFMQSIDHVAEFRG